MSYISPSSISEGSTRRFDLTTRVQTRSHNQQLYDDVTVAATSFFNRYDDVMVAATSFFNRYDDIILEEEPAVVGREKLATGFIALRLACDWMQHLATGFPNDWLDQTMSYQLIQTTSFAMHHRLVEYNAEALDWMYNSCLVISCDCWSLPSQNLPTDSYRKCKTLSFQLIQETSFCNCQLQISSAGEQKLPADYDVTPDDIIYA
ncbi:F-box/LRR-repeat protein [Dorcoceras hygrometricum]|uniref:F-box/LRR-repeat protein n=1 Tax=Dorcoceras hygrometricum TaxID=472368 RepID=A0A2Z7C6G9_9LAMI|nr:F-box/LRR-repeat protein [Dorcoceras hygrometricum]